MTERIAEKILFPSVRHGSMDVEDGKYLALLHRQEPKVLLKFNFAFMQRYICSINLPPTLFTFAGCNCQA